MTADIPGALHHNQGHGKYAEQFLPGSTRDVSQHLRASGVPWPVLSKSLFSDSDTLYPVGIQGTLWKVDSSCPPPRTQLWASAAFQKTGCYWLPPSCPALLSQCRLVTSQAPASTGQVALGTGASHSWVTMTPERGDSGALVSTGFRGKERSVGPAVGLSGQ